MSTKATDLRDRRALRAVIMLHDVLASQHMRQAEKHLRISQTYVQQQGRLNQRRRSRS